MIFGIGCDIAETKRFQKYANKEGSSFIQKIFAKEEMLDPSSFEEQKRMNYFCCHYASRFAAKEAFSKALGTGLVFDTKDVYVKNDENGKPLLFARGKALLLLEEKCGKNYVIHISLSHEKLFAICFVVIEKI